MSHTIANGLLTIGTVTATSGAAAIGIIGPEEIEAAKSAPATLILAAVAAWLAWLLYKQGESYRKSIDGIAGSLRELSASQAALAETMHNRPCVAGELIQVEREPRRK